ncbi:hypothetical protein EVAR_46290_1 [Eumeta japonica]|uniref:Uncharacterized protein n=1 Tax=Eumeta variegata TaxID=151549 RepID=A0A4C1Y0S0_EUMVA|nr:hypothetical protein EVAR_46290_1 [Eumeta japonica]
MRTYRLSARGIPPDDAHAPTCVGAEHTLRRESRAADTTYGSRTWLMQHVICSLCNTWTTKNTFIHRTEVGLPDLRRRCRQRSTFRAGFPSRRWHRVATDATTTVSRCASPVTKRALTISSE